MATGLAAVRTTSYLERLMRELGRRLKRMASGWSESGAAKMARILIKRICDPEQWNHYWKNQESSATATLFFDIFMVLMTSDRDRIFSRDLVHSLSEIKERPWAEMRKGKPLTEMALAGLLRPYGIRSRTIWIGEESAKGYLTQDFTEAVRRYALPLVQQLIEEAKGSKSQNHPTGQGAEASSEEGPGSKLEDCDSEKEKENA